MMIINWTIQLLLIPAISPFFIGLTRKIKAKLQNRQGASPFQPYRDLWKLFHKDERISEDASWIFYFAPFLIFATTLLIGASLPLASLLTPSITSDFLVVIYLSALGTFFLALSGLDVGGGFGGFGSSREMLVSALAEGGLILSILTLAIISHSTNLFSIASNINLATTSSLVSLILAFIAFVIVMLAETARFPFDNPATHLELTMIHEAMILEHSGKRLALMEWAAANKYLIFIVIGTNLFLPWGLSSNPGLLPLITGLLILLCKILVACLGVAVLESSTAKFRLFRLPKLLFLSFILSVIAIILII